MKTLQWLIKREFWENKGSFVWAPSILAAVMILILFVTLGMGRNLENLRIDTSTEGETIGQVTHSVDIGGPAVNGITSRIAETLGNNYMGFAIPIFAMVAIILFFYCLNSLYDERRDRSILFWKSLPISDGMTVASKAITALIVIPIITIVIAFATSMLALLMGCIALSTKGIHVTALIFSTPSVYLAPFHLVAMLPIYLLWALPTIGWLMMVSSWARSKVFLWAVGVPVLTIVLLGWMEKIFGFGWNVGWYAKNVVGRLLLGVFPGQWRHLPQGDEAQLLDVHHHGLNLSNTLSEAWSSLGTAEMWVGVIGGALMIGVAIYMRRWREEG